MKIDGRPIGGDAPVYIIAEMSANHGQSYERAEQTVVAAKECGADAVKLQTYTADTMTLDSAQQHFQIRGGTIWDGQSLYRLYQQAFMPWEWQPKLKKLADSMGIALFSTPFDCSSVDFLEKMDVAAYKVASFEVVDLPLIERIGRAKKPVILSTGMASESEIASAVSAAGKAGAPSIALLKCTSAYPAPYDEMNLLTIADMAKRFRLPIGLSDHTLGIAVPVAAVALGAKIIEKHFTLSRDVPGPDSTFSLEPAEFKEMVKTVRQVEQSLGKVCYGVTASQEKSVVFRRSLFIVADVKKGEKLTSDNVRSLRPGNGLAPEYLKDVLNQVATVDLKRGTPLDWAHITGKKRAS